MIMDFSFVLHLFFFRWEIVKEGEITRSPILGFGDGFYIKIYKKDPDVK